VRPKLGVMQENLEGAAHVIQLALTPVFLLSGVAALLSVFAMRLARVADQADRISGEPQSQQRDMRLKGLRFRSTCLEWAVVLAAVAGALTCGAVLVLFLGAFGVSAASVSDALFALFGGAIVLTTGALGAYVVEMAAAAGGIRHRVDNTTHENDPNWRR
jgi:Protein of unknown function (DUF2721)